MMGRTLKLDVIMEAVEEVKGTPREQWLRRHGDDRKWMILKLARHRIGMTLGELGEAIGGMDYAAVGKRGHVLTCNKASLLGKRWEVVWSKIMGRTLWLDVIIEAVEEVKGTPREEWLRRHEDDGKWMILKLARHRTGMTLRELREAVGAMDYAAVSMGIKRYEKKQERNKSLKKVHEKLVGKLQVKT